MKSRRTVIGTETAFSHEKLKAKQRCIRDGFPVALTLRVHRALSWYGRAEQESGDQDVRFILLWVAFNAAYAGQIDSAPTAEREAWIQRLGQKARSQPHGGGEGHLQTRHSEDPFGRIRPPLRPAKPAHPWRSYLA